MFSNDNSEYQLRAENNTLKLYVSVAVFNTTSDCHAGFLQWRSNRAVQNSPINFSLGDEAFLCSQGNITSVITFTKLNILVDVVAGEWIGHVYPWQYNATLAIAELPLEKINAYLDG